MLINEPPDLEILSAKVSSDPELFSLRSLDLLEVNEYLLLLTLRTTLDDLTSGCISIHLDPFVFKSQTGVY